MIRRRFVKLEIGIVPKETLDRALAARREYLDGLEAQGRSVWDGCWGSDGGGMMVFDAASLEEARDIVDADPLVRGRCVEYELKEWRLEREPGPSARHPAPGGRPSRSHPGFRHVALRVSDLARSEAFYTDAFGMREEWRPDPDNVYLTSGADNLALHRAAPLADPRDPRATLDHFGFVVGRREDVDDFAERLRQMEVPFAWPVKDHRDGARSFYVHDPDGNTVQVIFHPPLSAQG